MNYISNTQFTDYNPEIDVSLYTSATLSGMITRASAAIDDYLGYSLLAEDITGEKATGLIDSSNNMVIYTRKRPINSVSSVQIVKGTYSGTIDLLSGSTPKYDIPSTKDRIIFPGQDITMSTVSIIEWGALKNTNWFTLVSYNAGYQGYNIPVPIQDATQLWTMDIIMRKQNPGGATRIQQGGISISYESREGESDLIKDAKALLAPYKRVAYV
jgi:hypothetical protein